MSAKNKADILHLGGSVELVVGPQRGGKSDELIRRLRRAKHAQKKMQVFKPNVDSRRGDSTINTDDDLEMAAVSVGSSQELLELVESDTQWVGIDEVQFFDMGLPAVVDELALRGIRVIMAGLTADSDVKTFGPIDELFRRAEKITLMTAQCVICGNKASLTQRLTENTSQIVVSVDMFAPVCRHHHTKVGDLESDD